MLKITNVITICNLLGDLIKKLQSLGRDDAADILLRGAPLYHVSQQLMECPDTPSISSRNISR